MQKFLLYKNKLEKGIWFISTSKHSAIVILVEKLGNNCIALFQIYSVVLRVLPWKKWSIWTESWHGRIVQIEFWFLWQQKSSIFAVVVAANFKKLKPNYAFLLIFMNAGISLKLSVKIGKLFLRWNLQLPKFKF